MLWTHNINGKTIYFQRECFTDCWHFKMLVSLFTLHIHNEYVIATENIYNRFIVSSTIIFYGCQIVIVSNVFAGSLPQHADPQELQQLKSHNGDHE